MQSAADLDRHKWDYRRAIAGSRKALSHSSKLFWLRAADRARRAMQGRLNRFDYDHSPVKADGSPERALKPYPQWRKVMEGNAPRLAPVQQKEAA